MDESLPLTIHQALVREVKRRIMEESVPRIKKCLAQLSEEEIWYRPNEHVVSVGNLVLHLCGNLSQWVLSGLGGQPDHRQRDQEFDRTEPMAAETLIQQMDTLMDEVREVLDQLTPEELIRVRPVQVYEESGISILMHVTEHFSYHTGQITYYVKTRKNIDMQYYGGQDLNRTS